MLSDAVGQGTARSPPTPTTTTPSTRIWGRTGTATRTGSTSPHLEMAPTVQPSAPEVPAVEIGLFSIKNPKPPGSGPPSDVSPDTGDAKKGAKLFKAKCASCHTITQNGPNMQGPNLFGIMGEEAGKVREPVGCTMRCTPAAGCLLPGADPCPACRRRSARGTSTRSR